MLPKSPSSDGIVVLTPASVRQFAELVKKIETSPATSCRKRRNAARKKLKRVIQEQQRYAKTNGFRAVALTLTYRNAELFSAKHISAFLDTLRRALKRLGHVMPYAWVLESGSHVHYHLILWLPCGFTLSYAKLAKWWPWGSTWLEFCRSVKAWACYICKFDSIFKLPKGARVYGYGGLDEPGRLAISRAGWPRWLRALLPVGHRARRISGRGWVDVQTGEIYSSPYVWTPWGARLRR